MAHEEGAEFARTWLALPCPDNIDDFLHHPTPYPGEAYALAIVLGRCPPGTFFTSFAKKWLCVNIIQCP